MKLSQQLQSHKMEDGFSAAFQSHLVGDGLLISFASSLPKAFLVRNDFGSMSRSSDAGLLACFWYQSRSELDHLVIIVFIASLSYVEVIIHFK